MPNLTFYISEELLERIECNSELTQHCRLLCVEHLGAAYDKVHIIYISIKPGCGHPIYAELIYRLLPSRSIEIMTIFMHELHKIIQKTMHVTARIRCFAYPHQQINAYN